VRTLVGSSEIWGDWDPAFWERAWLSGCPLETRFALHVTPPPGKGRGSVADPRNTLRPTRVTMPNFVAVGQTVRVYAGVPKI